MSMCVIMFFLFVENWKYLLCVFMYCIECGEILFCMYIDFINFCCCLLEGEVIGEFVWLFWLRFVKRMF